MGIEKSEQRGPSKVVAMHSSLISFPLGRDSRYSLDQEAGSGRRIVLSVLEKAVSRGKIQIQFFLTEFPKPFPLILGIVQSHSRFQSWASFQY